MKPLLSLALLAVVVGTASCSSNTSASDDIVARVNGKEITTADLEKQYLSRINIEQPPSAEEALDLKLQLLNQMINDHILLERAAEAGLSATDADVDVQFNQFKSQYTEEQLQELLAQQKMTVEDLRDDIRQSITIEKLVNKEITSKISVSDAQIKDFYDKNKENFNLPESYRVAHILITPIPEADIANTNRDDATTPEEARQKATRVLRDIQGGQDFAVVARNFSEDASTVPAGGELGFLPMDQIAGIDPALADTVQRLRVGETSPVIETRYGYQIVKLLERDAGGQKELTDPRVQAQVRQILFQQRDQILKAAFSEEARNGAQIQNFLARRILDTSGKAQ